MLLRGGPLNGEIQGRIDAVNWYHEFDFGNGLVARPGTPDVENHRSISAFIRLWLDTIDFAGKTVLDIGCWDGYWSFYAEQRGAARVLATDDADQNWAGDSGLRLAKELLHSKIETNINLPVYRLTELQTKFDIILCLGVYYHLIDPFYAFAQIRHCCHDHTTVVFEGDVRTRLPPETGIYGTAGYNFWSSGHPRFYSTPAALSGLLQTAYFTVESEAFLWPWNLEVPRPSLRDRVRRAIRAFKTADAKTAENRIFLICRPYRGENRSYWYRPPFGLDRYDTRWGGRRA
jgi:tRNA (mo5U34)-methyltransferase